MDQTNPVKLGRLLKNDNHYHSDDRWGNFLYLPILEANMTSWSFYQPIYQPYTLYLLNYPFKFGMALF